mmetsp:Transcript_49005/g.115084  ORF Transcript_49005/g.115084 Transcript_49005/m.115084 type:complete len:415 (-) Transcript_49005:1265-2509(-)
MKLMFQERVKKAKQQLEAAFVALTYKTSGNHACITHHEIRNRPEKQACFEMRGSVGFPRPQAGTPAMNRPRRPCLGVPGPLRRGHGRPVPHRRHFRQDAERNLRRRAGTDVEAHRAVQAVEFGRGQTEVLGQARTALGLIDARTNGADVEGRAPERFHQRKVVELGIVGQRHDRGGVVDLEGVDDIVRHRADQRDARQCKALGVFLARVADGHAIAQGLGDLGKIVGHLAGADDEQPPLRAVMAGQVGLGQRQRVGAARRRRQRHHAGGQVQAAADPFTAAQACEQFVERRLWAERFKHQLQRAAAGQAEAAGLFRAHAVAQQLRPGECQAACPQLGDEVVLDATARHRAGDQPVLPNGHQRAHRPRRRAPGSRDGAQHHAAGLRPPGRGGAQHAKIEVVHALLWLRMFVRPRA